MRDHMERIVILPFSFGCASDSSVSVGKSIDPPIKMKMKIKMKKKKKRVSEENLPHTRSKEEKERASRGRMRRVKVLLRIPKAGMQRLIKGFKTFSLFFVYKEDDEEEEDKEGEMEIGLPTDVKHVTHIGWDGSTTINPIEGWANLKPPEIMSFPSISLEQFEFAMNSQTAPPPPLTT